MTIVGAVFYVFMGTDFQPSVSLLRQDVAQANRHLAWNGVRVRLLPAPRVSAGGGVAGRNPARRLRSHIRAARRPTPPTPPAPGC